MTPVASDPYKILQVDLEAEDEVITAAYRRLARKYHPDVAPDPESAARMAAINAAFDLIGEPHKRRAFDDERALRAARARAAERASASATGVASPAAAPAAGAPAAASTSGRSASAPERPREPETVSRDWSSGRSSVGGGYDASMRQADGTGAAGSPPGRPSGSVLTFGRYAGWSLGEVARTDIDYIEWLDRTPIGRPFRDEIDGILRQVGRRRSAEAESTDRRGLFRRR